MKCLSRWSGGSPAAVCALVPFALLVVLACSAVGVQASEPRKLNAEESKISFLGKKSDGKHDGGFRKFQVAAVAEGESLSKLRLEIETASLWADNPRLEAHLKNPDFFNVRRYPKVIFESTAIQSDPRGPDADGKDRLVIVGQMTMLEKTVELKVPATVSQEAGGLTLEADFLLDRTKWGMNYGEGNIENDVAVTAKLVLER